jgi:hypothetical protein
MSRQSRPPNIMVICAARMPSVELGAIIPLSELQKQGLCVFKYKDEIYLSLNDIVWCDILLIIRGASSQSVWAAREAKNLDRLVLGYWDDDFLSIPRHNLNYGYYSSPEVKENINTLFKLTNTFFCPNPKLAGKLSSIHGSEAKVLPGVLGSEALRQPKLRNNHPPIIGFAGSVVYVSQLDSLLGPAIAAAAATSNDFTVHIIGTKPNFIGRLPVETVYTQHMQNYYDYLDFASQLNWDIGLAPQVDDEFANHKFYNKLLEYTHIGCAGIYSKVELYTDVIQDGITGLLVENQIEAWRDAILRLLKEPELRFKIASNAYEFVQSHHSRAVVAEQYAAALAPFFSYRAPSVGKKYIIANDTVDRLVRLWRMGTEYLKVYGFWRLIRAAPRYLLSLIRGRIA